MFFLVDIHTFFQRGDPPPIAIFVIICGGVLQNCCVTALGILL